MQRTNSRPLLLLTYSTVWQTATVCTNGTFGFESLIVTKKKKKLHNAGRVSGSAQLVKFKRQHNIPQPATSRRNRLTDLDVSEVISRSKPGSVLRGLRGMNLGSLSSNCKRCKRFWAA